jgi:hypothetical protein
MLLTTNSEISPTLMVRTNSSHTTSLNCLPMRSSKGRPSFLLQSISFLSLSFERANVLK